jgi:hypothetical protein
MLKSIAPYAVELDGSLSICLRGELQTLDDLRRIEGDCRVVSDLQGAIARTMTVEADSRYVELMISKKMQESGEFDEPVTVISHWKKKQARNTTDIFFSALPTRSYYQYLEMVRESRNHLVLLPLQSVLLAALRKKSGQHPAAVVFQHDRFADVIVGTRDKVWYANRAVAFDTSLEQIQSLWETVRTDIHMAANERRRSIHKIYVLTWTTSHPLPQWTDPDAPELVLMDEQAVLEDDELRKASLPAMAHATSGGRAITTGMEKACYGARRVLPYVNILLLLLTLVCTAGGLWYQHRSADLRNRVAALRANAVKINDRSPAELSLANYEPVLKFLEQLRNARSLPGYSQLLRDFSTAAGSEMQLEVFKADYDDGKVQIEAYGTAQAPFDRSYGAYQGLQQKLRRRGYEILEQHFDTRIDRSDFTLRLVKELR